jgi:hypothetical protein
MINRTNRPDNVNADHATVFPAGKDDNGVNRDEHQTPAGDTPGHDAEPQDAVIQQARAERFPAGRVL